MIVVVALIGAAISLASAAATRFYVAQLRRIADDIAAVIDDYHDARHEHHAHDRKSLACWLEIRDAMAEDRDIAPWAWTWANGIDEDEL